MKFSDLKFVKRNNGGKLDFGEDIQAIAEFPNGYGASVVRFPGVHNYHFGRYEIAVLKGGNLCYTTPVTNYTVNNLTESGVTEILAEIGNLPNA